MRNNTYVQSLDRGLTILDVLSDGSPELGVTELALRLGVHKSTVFRLLSTLQGHDLVEQNSETEKYRLGYGLVRLSGAVVAPPSDATRASGADGEIMGFLQIGSEARRVRSQGLARPSAPRSRCSEMR